MAAEIARAERLHPAPAAASMRPRRMAAEIALPPRAVARTACGFNEAAANGRGNLTLPIRKIMLNKASMRPRRMAAEIAGPPAAGRAWPARFNEAAANGRGNPGNWSITSYDGKWLQ